MTSRQGRRNAITPNLASPASSAKRMSVSARNGDRILAWARNFIEGRVGEEIVICDYIFRKHDGGEGGGTVLELPDAPPADMQGLIGKLMGGGVPVECKTVLSEEHGFRCHFEIKRATEEEEEEEDDDDDDESSVNSDSSSETESLQESLNLAEWAVKQLEGLSLSMDKSSKEYQVVEEEEEEEKEIREPVLKLLESERGFERERERDCESPPPAYFNESSDEEKEEAVQEQEQYFEMRSTSSTSSQSTSPYKWEQPPQPPPTYEADSLRRSSVCSINSMGSKRRPSRAPPPPPGLVRSSPPAYEAFYDDNDNSTIASESSEPPYPAPMLYSMRGSMSSESSISCLTIDPTLTQEGLGGSQRWDESGTVGTGDSTVEEEAEVQNNNVVGLARTPPPPFIMKVVSGERIKLHKSKMGRRATTASVMFDVGGEGDRIAKPSEMVKETQRNSGRGEGRGGGQTKVPNNVFLHPVARKQRRGSGGASIHSMTASARARVAERRKSML